MRQTDTHTGHCNTLSQVHEEEGACCHWTLEVEEIPAAWAHGLIDTFLTWISLALGLEPPPTAILTKFILSFPVHFLSSVALFFRLCAKFLPLFCPWYFSVAFPTSVPWWMLLRMKALLWPEKLCVICPLHALWPPLLALSSSPLLCIPLSLRLVLP